MAIIAKEEKGLGFEPIPEGVHTAICTALIDLGLQYSEKFGKSTRKVMVTWEFPDETYEKDGVKLPRTMSKEYSLGLSEKSNLRKDLQAWRGKAFTEQELEGFDLKNVLGKGCQIQVIHSEKSGKSYANIASIMGLPKGMTINPPETLTYFDLTDPDCMKLTERIPEWIMNKIRESETWAQMHEATTVLEATDDELPF